MPRLRNYPDLIVERRPDWLLVKFFAKTTFPDERFPLAVQLWDLMQLNGTKRLVLEIAGPERLSDYVLWQLVALTLYLRRIEGMIRFRGMSHRNRVLLQRYTAVFCSEEDSMASEEPLGLNEGQFQRMLDVDARFEEGQ